MPPLRVKGCRLILVAVSDKGLGPRFRLWEAGPKQGRGREASGVWAGRGGEGEGPILLALRLALARYLGSNLGAVWHCSVSLCSPMCLV